MWFGVFFWFLVPCRLVSHFLCFPVVQFFFIFLGAPKGQGVWFFESCFKLTEPFGKKCQGSCFRDPELGHGTSFLSYPHRKTNECPPENQWLEDVFLIEIVPFFGTFVTFRGCKFEMIYIISRNRTPKNLFARKAQNIIQHHTNPAKKHQNPRDFSVRHFISSYTKVTLVMVSPVLTRNPSGIDQSFLGDTNQKHRKIGKYTEIDVEQSFRSDIVSTNYYGNNHQTFLCIYIYIYIIFIHKANHDRL